MKAELDALILVDESGRPIPKPAPPPEVATIEERIAYMRAMNYYRDRVTDIANRAFADAFRKGIRS